MNLTGFLMRDRALFESLNLLPKNLPSIENGYMAKGQIYLIEKDWSDYYRRHLLIHEGTHWFQFEVAEMQAEQWFSEGIAEWFATHRWQAGQLECRRFPQSSSEVAKWGRLELLQQDLDAGRELKLADLRLLHSNDFAQNESYAWTWALATLLDKHPTYREDFRQVRIENLHKNVNSDMVKFFKEHKSLQFDFRVFVRDECYGYDFERNVITYQRGQPVKTTANETASVRADIGWQATSWRVERGREYEITATGSCLLKQAPKPWPSEPNGITLRYFHGQPLGILLGAIVENENAEPFLTAASLTAAKEAVRAKEAKANE